MSFLIKDDELLEKYYEILEKVKSSIKKEFDSDIKVFMTKKKKLNTNLSEKQKKKLAKYRRNYYLTHKK